MNERLKNQELRKEVAGKSPGAEAGKSAGAESAARSPGAEAAANSPGAGAAATLPDADAAPGSWADGPGFADKRPREFDYEKMRLPRSKSFWMPLAYAALAGFAFMSLRFVQVGKQLEESARVAEERSGTIASLESEITSLRATSDQQAALVRLLNQPGSGLVTLAPLASAPGASGKVFWDRGERQGYLWVSNLPADPEGKDYQLWAIAGGAPVSAGVFSVQNGNALIPLQSLPGEGIAAFAITLEPAGGAPAPSGDRVLLGNVGE